MVSVFVSSSRKIIKDYSDELLNTHLHLTSSEPKNGKRTFTFKWVIENLLSLTRGTTYSNSTRSIRVGDAIYRLRISRQPARPCDAPDRPTYLLLGLTPSLGEFAQVNFSIVGPNGEEIEPEGNCLKTGLQIPNRKCYAEFLETRAFMWLPLTVLVKIQVKEQAETNIVLEKCDSLFSDLEKLMMNPEHSDCTIEVDGEQFLVHRAILSARSPVFRVMFQNDMKERVDNTLVIKDCTAESFHGLIKYLYTGKTIPLTTEQAFGLLSLADRYNVHELQKEVEEYLHLNIELGNVVQMLFIADAHSSMALKKDVLAYIGKNLKEVMSSSDWYHLRSRPDLLEDVLKYFA